MSAFAKLYIYPWNLENTWHIVSFQKAFVEEGMNKVAWALCPALLLICYVIWTSAKPQLFLNFCGPLVWNRGIGDWVSLRISPALASTKYSGEKARPGVFDDYTCV